MERYPEPPPELDIASGLVLTGWGIRGVVDFAAGLF
jgi:hypothetical protein